MGLDRSSSPPAHSGSTSTEDASRLRGVVFEAHQQPRPQAYSVAPSTSSETVSTQNALGHKLHQPGLQMSTVLNAPTQNVIRGTVLNQTSSPPTTVVDPSLDSGRIIEHLLDPIVS